MVSVHPLMQVRGGGPGRRWMGEPGCDDQVYRWLPDACKAACCPDILRRRWMAEEKATLHELAAEHGVSAERIRQIEVAAMSKLKGLMVEA